MFRRIGRNQSRQRGQDELEFIKRRVSELSPWYHCIDLGGGVVTPGRNYERVWEPIKKLIENIDYRGKSVLDLASWDGYWAFEAERLGAALVVATDARLEGYQNLLFARSVLDSNVIPLCNVPVQDLESRLQSVGLADEFDIIQHFGLFYHLRDPLLSLAQCRKMLRADGKLILETAFINDDSSSYMMFSGLPGDYHFYGESDTWAPTLKCLREILVRSFLMPVLEDRWQISEQMVNIKGPGGVPVKFGRITLVAEPMPMDEGSRIDRRKVVGTQ